MPPHRVIPHPQPVEQLGSQHRPGHTREHHQHRSQGRQPADFLGNAHGHRRGRRFRRQGHLNFPGTAEQPGQPDGTAGGDHHAAEQGNGHRQPKLAQTRELLIQGHRQCHGGRPQQKMDELGPLEIILVGGAGGHQHRDQQRHRPHHRIHQRIGPGPQVQPVCQTVGHQRHGQAQQRRRRQVNPDIRQAVLNHGPAPPVPDGRPASGW